MSILEILRAPWAIAPDKLAEIQAIYDTHLRGDKIDIAAVEARLGHSLQNEPTAYTVQDGGVAVLNIDGVIAPKANLFTRISGGVMWPTVTEARIPTPSRGVFSSRGSPANQPMSMMYTGRRTTPKMRMVPELSVMVSLNLDERDDPADEQEEDGDRRERADDG